MYPQPSGYLSFGENSVASERQASFKLQLVNASVSQDFLQNETGTCIAELS